MLNDKYFPRDPFAGGNNYIGPAATRFDKIPKTSEVQIIQYPVFKWRIFQIPVQYLGAIQTLDIQ